MKDHRSSVAIKWNLMLLVGRPLACVGCFQFLRGLTAVRYGSSGGEGFIVAGLGLIFIGIVIAWTGKIGKTLFYQ